LNVSSQAAETFVPVGKECDFFPTDSLFLDILINQPAVRPCGIISMSMALAPSAKANQFFPSANICTMDMYSRKRKNHNQPCAEPSCRTKICQTSLWSKEAQAIDIAKLLHDSLQVHCQAKIE
jgi:hypothetical protein